MSVAREKKGAVTEQLARLRTALDAAVRMTDELTGDPVFAQWLAAYEAMPYEDRPVVTEAVDREMKARALSRATEEVTGQSMVPNRNARLYLRAHESGIDRNLLERDEMMLATLQAMRVAALVSMVPAIHEGWLRATRDAATQVDEPTRAIVEGLLREALAVVEEVRAGSSPAEHRRTRRAKAPPS